MFDQTTNQETTNRKPLPIIVGIIVVALVAGGLFLLTRNAGKQQISARNPDVSGLLDLWKVDGSKAYAIVVPGSKKPSKHAITLDESTQYVYLKGKKRDPERPEEKGALANISEGLYVGIFFKPNTQIADTIIYADWPF